MDEINGLVASAGLRNLDQDEQERFRKMLGLKKTDINRPVNADITYPQALRLLFQTLFKSKYISFTLALYVIVTAWHIRVWIHRLFDTQESFYLGVLYGFLALNCFCYILYFSRKHSVVKDIRLYNVSKYLSWGLFSQWSGLMAWSYYFTIGIPVPYPSIADVGYFGLIPCYLLALLELYRRQKPHPGRTTFEKKSLLFFIPVFVLIACYSIFLNTIGVVYIRQLKLVLDIIFPLGEMILVLLILYLILKTKVDTLTRVNYFLLLIAFSFQFAAEYSFIYAAQINAYVNGGINDFIYATSYMIMNLAVVSFSAQTLPNFALAYEKVRLFQEKNKAGNKPLKVLPFAHINETL